MRASGSALRCVNDVVVRHKVIETARHQICFRLYHGLIRVLPGKFLNCFHRVPEREHYEFDSLVDRVSQ